MHAPSSRLLGFLCLASGYAAFSCADICAKYLGKTQAAAPTLLLMYTAMLLGLVPVASRFGGFSRMFRTQKLKLHIARGAVFALGCFLFVAALQKTDMTRAYAIVFTIPFVSTALAVFLLGEKAGWKSWALIALGFSGVLTVLRPGISSVSVPDLMVMASVPPLALFLILTRKIGRDEPLAGFVFWPGIFIVFLSLLWCAWTKAWPTATAFELALGFCGGIAVLTGQVLTARGYNLVPLSQGTPIHYTQILWGILFGRLLFGEQPDVWTYAGTAIIIAAGVALVRQKA